VVAYVASVTTPVAALAAGQSFSPCRRGTPPSTSGQALCVVVVVVPQGGDDGEVGVVKEVLWENGTPALDLFVPIRAGMCH
jgi:hypothetical protein